jgi:mannose-6-phosphate isomerase-like protein (cupin superfamily)
VTNEPRPSEFLHWDADSVAGFKSELEGELREGPGIFGTQFAVLNALPRADHRPHDVQIIYRSGYTQPEIHETKWDTYVVLDGSGTVLVGGERTNWVEGLPRDEQRPELSGAQEFHITKGDMLHVPARSWHQVKLADGESITYALINVLED